MKVRTNRLDKPNRTTSERHRRSLLAAAAIALGGSLLLLLGAGWLQHGVSKMAISGLGTLLLIGAHRDLSHAGLFDASISKWNSAPTGLDSHSRLPDRADFYCDRGPAGICFVARGNARQLPVLASAERASRLLCAVGESVLVRRLAMNDGSVAVSRADRLPNADNSVPRWSWVFFNPGDPSTVHIFFPFRCRSRLPDPVASVDPLRGNVVV